jgi:hypothetical protein
MNNHLTDFSLLKKYLQKSKIYGEYGAGDSTVYASQEPTIQEVHSVESDKQWIEDTRAAMSQEGKAKTHFYYKEMGTRYKNWGHPGPNATDAQKRAYSDPLPNTSSLDIVLIDGRFRVATALKLHQAISDTTYVAFDDFLIRPQYHDVLDYYTLVEQGKTMVILQRDSARPPPESLLAAYELKED